MSTVPVLPGPVYQIYQIYQIYTGTGNQMFYFVSVVFVVGSLAAGVFYAVRSYNRWGYVEPGAPSTLKL